MTDSSNPKRSSGSTNSTYAYDVGYRKPPKHSQFAKGRSGNSHGRPKKPVGISIKEILDGEQLGKNGKVISRRKAYVIALVNDALRGDQKAFSKFMKLLNRAGLMRQETTIKPTVVEVPLKTMNAEEFRAHIKAFKTL